MAYLKKMVRTQHRVYVQRVKCWCYNHASIRGKRRVRKFATSESKALRNKRAALNKRKYEIDNNFTIGDYWITLTWNKDRVPDEPIKAHKELMSILAKISRKLKRKGIPLVYYAKTEAGEGQRVHHHLFIKNNFDVIGTLFELWKDNGKIKDFQEIYNMESGKLIEYFLNSGNHKELNFEKYSHSRGLKQPEIEVQIMPFKSFRENPKPPRSDDEGYQYIIQRLYNGYCDLDGFTYQEYELIKVKVEEYNDFKENDRFMQKEKKGDNS